LITYTKNCSLKEFKDINKYNKTKKRFLQNEESKKAFHTNVPLILSKTMNEMLQQT
jgi:hypothetical protein